MRLGATTPVEVPVATFLLCTTPRLLAGWYGPVVTTAGEVAVLTGSMPGDKFRILHARNNVTEVVSSKTLHLDLGGRAEARDRVVRLLASEVYVNPEEAAWTIDGVEGVWALVDAVTAYRFGPPRVSHAGVERPDFPALGKLNASNDTTLRPGLRVVDVAALLVVAESVFAPID